MNFLENDDAKYMRAKERVALIKKFYTSVLSYIVVISFLAYLNYEGNKWGYAWFLWPALGWGIGLLFQGAKAFGWNPFFGKQWEERKMKEFMEDDRSSDRWKQQ